MKKTTWGLMSATLLLSTACGSAAPSTPKAPASARTAAPETTTAAQPKPIRTGAMVPEDPDEVAIRELDSAYRLFATFVEKAGDDPRYADAVKRAKDRMEDIGAMHAFLEDGLRQRHGR